MAVYSYEDATRKEFPTNFHGQLFPNTLGLKCVEITIQVGGEVPVHSKECDVVIYVIEGSVEVTIGDEVAPASAGMVAESPVDKVHGIKNIGDTTARILVIKKLQ